MSPPRVPLNFIATPSAVPRVAVPRAAHTAPAPTLPTALPAATPARPINHAPSDPATLPSPTHSLLSVPLFPSPPAPGGAGRRVVVWFRSDLRLHDHPALTHALEEAAGSGGAVVPVFCFDPRAFGKTAFGFEKTGRHRANFLIESVQALRAALRERGSDLVVRVGRAEQVLPALCKRVGARMVCCHKEVSYEDKKLERVVEAALEKARVEFQPLWANTLYHVDDLPFPIDEIPDVYTEFREMVQKRAVIRDPLPAPERLQKIPKVEAGHVPTLAQLGLTDPTLDAAAGQRYRGGEDEAVRRLQVYVEESGVTDDACSSSTHLGAEFTCRISPWLALGCVSPRKIYADLSQKGRRAGQTTAFFELTWRDFFRYITAKYNRAKVMGKASATPSSSSVRQGCAMAAP